MIDKLISTSRVTEVNDVATRSSGAFGESGVTDPYLTTTFGSLDAANLTLSLAIKRSKAESVLEEKDEVRDNKVRALYYLLNGFLYHPAQEIKDAARLLMDLFDNYGLTIVGESYTTESSLIDSLLLDLAKPKYAEAIAALSGCTDLIAQLQTAEDDFEQARIAYETEKAKEGMVSNATLVKKEVLNLLNDKIVVYLRGMEQANPAIYGVFVATVAQIIADTNEQVKKRQQKPDVTPGKPD
ncbi:MAG: DUF6261 family protein [Candidatus Doudnabacteria bacterium]